MSKKIYVDPAAEKAQEAQEAKEEKAQEAKEAAEKAKAEKEAAAAELEDLRRRVQEAEKAAKEAKAAEKAAKEAAAAAEKAIKGRKIGDLDRMALLFAEIGKEGIQLSKAEILDRYLAALGVEKDDPAAILKAATLDAQIGSRILKRLHPLGWTIVSSHVAGTRGNFYSVIPFTKG